MKKMVGGALVVVLGAAFPAAAHDQMARSEAYRTGSTTAPVTSCITGLFVLSESTSASPSMMRIAATATASSGATHGGECDRTWTRPKGWLATSPELWKRGPDGHWAYCAPRFSKLGVWHSHEKSTQFGWSLTYSRPPCGPGIYTFVASALVKDQEGKWFDSGWIDTKDHAFK